MTPKTETWLSLALDDLDFAEEVLKNKKRPHFAAHLCQQAIEKLLKAIVQAKTNSTPLHTHNLKSLCQQANLVLTNDKMEWLLDLTPHYIGARYPEDLMKLQKKYTQQFCEKLFQETKEFFEWLKTSYLK